MIQTRAQLEAILEKLPISKTPPYFAECVDTSKVSIISGAGDTFNYSAEKDKDNPWVYPVGSSLDELDDVRQKVKEELAELENHFEELGFKVHTLPAEVAGMFNWIYINNAMAASFSPDGKPLIYFGSMLNDNRQPEPALVEFYLKGLSPDIPNLLEGINILRASCNPMEGKGDQLPMSLPVTINGKQSQDRFYHAIINCSGRRTSCESIMEYEQKTGNVVIEIPLPKDSQSNEIAAYHGNVSIAYFQNKQGNRGVIYVPNMLELSRLDDIYSLFTFFFGKEYVHTITPKHEKLYEEATQKLSLNIISAGKGNVLSSEHNQYTNEFLENDLGLNIMPVDLRAITLGGGGLQCCYTAINHHQLQMVEESIR